MAGLGGVVVLLSDLTSASTEREFKEFLVDLAKSLDPKACVPILAFTDSDASQALAYDLIDAVRRLYPALSDTWVVSAGDSLSTGKFSSLEVEEFLHKIPPMPLLQVGFFDTVP